MMEMRWSQRKEREKKKKKLKSLPRLKGRSAIARQAAVIGGKFVYARACGSRAKTACTISFFIHHNRSRSHCFYTISPFKGANTPNHNTNTSIMSPDDISSTIQAMRMQESRGYKCADYLSHRQQSHKPCHASPVDAECRFKMVEWCYQVVDFCKFGRETVAIAMSYLDRYLMTEAGRPALDDRKIFQLAAITSVYTAIKIHEPQAMESKVVAKLSRGTYTEQQVTDMEMSILVAIEWRMNPPTALSFLNAFFALLPEGTMIQMEQDAMYEFAKFQTELAVNEFSLVAIDASTVAFSALLNALETIAAGTIDVAATLAKVSCIDSESNLVLETKDMLYQAVRRGVSSTTGPAVQLAPKSPTKIYVGRRGSVHVSPRSVVNSQ